MILFYVHQFEFELYLTLHMRHFW